MDYDQNRDIDCLEYISSALPMMLNNMPQSVIHFYTYILTYH
ncbi:hypothetical protein XBFFL1_2670002 [Xenorhabdus bovienii str. feltiae Florida]|uniref:Uncharacterized protein n=1 Tax=Xenorhabdus bovienii str. feltiae Moldova TaxID=1398200 RepID=A0A077NQX9_XENBV|nr:hypothetical protein XBFFR1_2570002 [Xenorhabdus bovienii str. feltiae France]CDG93715.1 hypothetical protein XBFFL1_2670002 [Xenorhabdus bovienii str. feltiae Florida]CDH00808.1 hypothetical protein XBFM1_1900002 [Xenorhabdus bovienii str. feltiae Moldova]